MDDDQRQLVEILVFGILINKTEMFLKHSLSLTCFFVPTGSHRQILEPIPSYKKEIRAISTSLNQLFVFPNLLTFLYQFIKFYTKNVNKFIKKT